MLSVTNGICCRAQHAAALKRNRCPTRSLRPLRTIIRLGAIADLDPSGNGDPRQLRISVSEFIDTEDGRRIVLHADRGYTATIHPDGDIWEHATAEAITRDVLNTVLPDDDPVTEDHPYEWLAGLARERGLPVTAAELRALPYVVELTDRVRERLPA